MICYMDIYEARRTNLRAIMNARFDGKMVALAAAVDRAQSYLSRCLTPNETHRKRIGEELARDIEAKLGLEALALDQVSGTDQSNADPGPVISTPFRSVKIAGTAQLGAEGYWTALSPCEGHVDIPTRDKDAYALRLRGDSMSPAIRSGWVAVCEPNSQLIPGEYVHIKLKGFDGEGESMVKELLYANDEEISVMSINDAFGRRTLALADIEYIHPVPFIVAPSKIVQ